MFHCTNVEVSFTAIHKLACLPISQQWALELPMIRFYFMPTNQPIAPLQNYSQYHIHISLVLALSFFFLPFAPPPPPPPCVSYCSGLFEDSPRDDKIIWEMIFVEQKDYINENWYSEKKSNKLETNGIQYFVLLLGGGGVGEEKLISNRKED